MKRTRSRAARLTAAVLVVPLLTAAASLLTAAPASAAAAPSAIHFPHLPHLPFFSSCKNSPVPQAPGGGMPGWFETPPRPLPAPGTWTGPNPDTTEFEQYGYAGLTWNTYDLGCIGQINPVYELTTLIGNVGLTAAETLVAADNAVHDWASSPAWLSSLSPLVTDATKAVHDALFTPWAAVTLLILALTLMARARKADLSGTVTAAGWALLVLTLVAGVTAYPTWAGRQATALLGSTLNAMDAGFVGPAGQAHAADAHASLLVGSILYPMWLRGEFGQSAAPAARRYGLQLLQDQALTWRQAAGSPQEVAAVTKQEQSAWAKVAANIKSADPAAYGVLQGTDGSRWGTGLLALLLAVITCTFDLFASMVVIVALLTVLMATIVLPGLAVVGLHHSMRHVVTGLLSRAGGMLMSGVLYSAAAGVDSRATQLLLTNNLMPLPLAILLLLILPIALFVVVRRARAGRVIPRSVLVAAGLLAATRWTSRAAREGAEEGAGQGAGQAAPGQPVPGPAWAWNATASPVRPNFPPLPGAPAGGGPGLPPGPPPGSLGGWPRRPLPGPPTGPPGPGGPPPAQPPGPPFPGGPPPAQPPGGGGGGWPAIPPAGGGRYYDGSERHGDGPPSATVLQMRKGPDGEFMRYDGGPSANDPWSGS